MKCYMERIPTTQLVAVTDINSRCYFFYTATKCKRGSPFYGHNKRAGNAVYSKMFESTVNFSDFPQLYIPYLEALEHPLI